MLSQSTLAPVALSIRSNVTAATIHDLLSALEDVTLTVTTPEISVVHETNVPYDGYNGYADDLYQTPGTGYSGDDPDPNQPGDE